MSNECEQEGKGKRVRGVGEIWSRVRVSKRAIGEVVHCFVKSTFIYICDNGRG